VYAPDWLFWGIVRKPTAFVPSAVQLVRSPEAGIPSAGVTNVGLVANTKAPVPVSSVTAEAKFALDGVPRNVATPAPRDVIPVPPLATGRVPVTLVVRFANVVEVVPVPPLAIGSVPVTLVVKLVKVVELVPVPPFAIGKMPDTSVVNTAGLLATLTKSDPFHATSARAPAGTVTPVVGPAPRRTIEPVPALITM
jgi:hypothetical protein